MLGLPIGAHAAGWPPLSGGGHGSQKWQASQCRGCMKLRLQNAPPWAIFVRSTSLLMAAGAADTASRHLLRGTCFCKAVTVAVDLAAKPMASSICHCRSCRSLTGAPMLANVIFAKSAVQLESSTGVGAPELHEQQTSKHVKRLRCASCYGPVMATMNTNRSVVPLSLFAREQVPESWRTQAHIWYDSRVMDVRDGLPKYRLHFGSQQCGDGGETVQPS